MPYDKIKIEAMIMEKNDLQNKLRRINSDLCHAVVEYDGTLVDALKIGIVKLNFPMPQGFKRHLMEN